MTFEQLGFEQKNLRYIMICVIVLLFVFYAKSNGESQKCNIQCPHQNKNTICALNINNKTYKMFPSNCAMDGDAKCHEIEYVRTPIKYCIKDQISSNRRMSSESCPVFCPSHYSPVCGASQYRSYVYRTFNNGCYLDMLNCRGDDDHTGFVEVPLQFCQHHLMKNVFKEKLIVSDVYDYRDYN